MPNQITNPNPTGSVRGAVIETERTQSEETRGNTLYTQEYEVPHGSGPSGNQWGLLESTVYNKGSKNKSWRRDVYVKTDDIYTLEDLKHDGLEKLGAENLTVAETLRKAGTETVQKGNLVIEDVIDRIDRFHSRQTTTTVDAWQQRVDLDRYDPDFGEVSTTRKVKASGAAWGIDSETIAAKREHIGNDKFLETIVNADQGLGSNTQRDTENTFGFDGCPTTTTVTKEASSFTMPTLTDAMVSQKLRDVNGLYKEYEVTTMDGGISALTKTSYEEEPQTGKKVTVVRNVTSSEPTFDTNGSAREVVDVRQTGCSRWLTTTRTIDASILSETFYEYHSVEYDFPSYLDEDTPVLNHATGSVAQLINVVKSSSFRFKVPCEFRITYHTSAPSAAEVFQFKTVDIDINTGDYRLSERNVLTDGFAVRVKVLNQLFKWLGGRLGSSTVPAYMLHDVVFQFGASSPTTSEYKDYMTNGNTALILEDSSRWKYNLWRRVKVYMTFPDLTSDLSGSLIYNY